MPIPTGLPCDEELVAKCLELGLTMRRAPAYDITHPTVTLFPSVIKATALAELYRKQALWNEAIDRTARNFSFLRSALRETAASDVAFTGKLLQMLERVYMSPPTADPTDDAVGPLPDHPVFQPLMLGVFRSDYMRDMDDSASAAGEMAEQWKSVEINTISCSFAGLSPLVNDFHSYLRKYQSVLLRGNKGHENDEGNHDRDDNTTVNNSTTGKPGTIERSVSGEAIPASLAVAHAAWKHAVPHTAVASAHHNSNSNSSTATPMQPAVLVVLQEGERNTGDQYKLHFTLLEEHGVVSIRRTMTQLHATMELVHLDHNHGGKSDNTSKYSSPPFAIVDGRYLVSVVYFRSTYAPADFPTDACWAVRESLERCNAVKCPSLPHHLMTFKKLQQLFCLVPSVLTPIAFGGNAGKAASLAAHFMGQHSLNKDEYSNSEDSNSNGKDGKATKSINDPEFYIQQAIAHPSSYVLKPQLEGGGNLIAGADMTALLQANRTPSDPEYNKIRKEYILMKKINYEKKDGLLFRQGARFFFDKNVCSELGIFGCILSDGSEASYVDDHGPVRCAERHRSHNRDHRNDRKKDTTTSPSSSPPLPSFFFNSHGGYVVRTKPADVEDGGVMAGVACLDNVMLA